MCHNIRNCVVFLYYFRIPLDASSVIRPFAGTDRCGEQMNRPCSWQSLLWVIVSMSCRITSPLLHIRKPVFPLIIEVSIIVQRTLKDSLWTSVVPSHVTEPDLLTPLVCSKKRFLVSWQSGIHISYKNLGLMLPCTRSEAAFLFSNARGFLYVSASRVHMFIKHSRCYEGLVQTVLCSKPYVMKINSIHIGNICVLYDLLTFTHTKITTLKHTWPSD